MKLFAITTATAGALAAAALGLAGAAAAPPTATSALCWLRPRQIRSPVVLPCKSFGQRANRCDNSPHLRR